MADLLHRLKYLQRQQAAANETLILKESNNLPDPKFEYRIYTDKAGVVEYHRVVHIASEITVIAFDIPTSHPQFKELTVKAFAMATRKAHLTKDTAMPSSIVRDFWMQDNELELGKHNYKEKQFSDERAKYQRQRRHYRPSWEKD